MSIYFYAFDAVVYAIEYGTELVIAGLGLIGVTLMGIVWFL